MKRHLAIVILSVTVTLGGGLAELVSSHALASTPNPQLRVAYNTGPQLHVALSPAPQLPVAVAPGPM